MKWIKSSHSGYNGDCVEVAFRKSSHSTANGDCVEIGWGKSSHSTANGACVEIGDGCGQVHVRDSKDPEGPVLTFTPAEWRVFCRTLAA